MSLWQAIGRPRSGASTLKTVGDQHTQEQEPGTSRDRLLQSSSCGTCGSGFAKLSLRRLNMSCVKGWRESKRMHAPANAARLGSTAAGRRVTQRRVQQRWGYMPPIYGSNASIIVQGDRVQSADPRYGRRALRWEQPMPSTFTSELF